MSRENNIIPMGDFLNNNSYKEEKILNFKNILRSPFIDEFGRNKGWTKEKQDLALDELLAGLRRDWNLRRDEERRREALGQSGLGYEDQIHEALRRARDAEEKLGEAERRANSYASRMETVRAQLREAEGKVEGLVQELGEERRTNRSLTIENGRLRGEHTRSRTENERLKAENEMLRRSTTRQEPGGISADLKGHFRVLGLRPDAFNGLTDIQIEKLIGRLRGALAQIHHPDAGGDTRRMQKINEACDFLADPVKRRAYR